MRKRKLWSILLVMALLVSSVACQGSKTNENDENVGANTSAENSVEEANTSAENNAEEADTNDLQVAYAEKIFNNSYVHTIDIEISEEDWADLRENPLDKTKYEVNATIDGEKIESVSFATKGNTSLSSVASDSDSDRYSFKINFGKYVEGQTYYGLDKLNLTNIYADATYMKDYLSYEIFRAAGVEAPLTSYVSISINGEAFGLYLAIEEVGESYLERTTDGEGELYKPESEQLENIGKAEMPEGMEVPEGMEKPEGMEVPEGMEKPEGMEMPEGMEKPEGMEMPEGMEKPEGMEIPEEMEKPEGMEMPQGMGGFDSSNGASLEYTDDEIDSYSDIFDNAETDAEEEDMQRVIEALKGISEGEDLEKYLDVEEVIRYFVAHNFVMNYDSYTGNMLHNYYLYEKDGQLSMLPWDYNLAFGAFSMGMGENVPSEKGENVQSADTVVNYAIDTPLSGATEENRPMWSWIVQNEEYLELYHSCFDELLTNYFESGEFETEIERVYEMIKPYVEKDASAFYTVDEFEKGYETLKEFCLLRAESIRKQLEGTLASVTQEQNAEDYVNAEGINIRDMGVQNQEKNMKKTP